jgi:hypothetical protein
MDQNPSKVVVTFGEVERIFAGREALDGLTQSAIEAGRLYQRPFETGFGGI